MEWGSDAVAELLRRIGFEYISVSPGASYRGLHDSLVNYLGNHDPEIVMSLHEEHAVALAHGFAKVTGRPLAVALHSNVGLMHATMALYNAFCDRVPMLVLGATGPVDSAERRPWIDWIHTAADQGALIRNYVKWDDQPASAEAAVESVLHAYAVTRTYPTAPVYVCLDAADQERRLLAELSLPDVARHRAAPLAAPAQADLEQAVALLRTAKRPLVLVGRVGRDEAAWAARIALAERLGACVVTDLKTGASFPTDHPLQPVPAGTFPDPAALDLLRASDAVLSLDWIDLGGTLALAGEGQPFAAPVISCSSDFVLHNGWSKDHFSHPPADVRLPVHPDLAVDGLLALLPAEMPPLANWPPPGRASGVPPPAGEGLALCDLASGLASALDGRAVCLIRVPLGWRAADWPFVHPLDYLGQDGGAGLGSGPGMAVGAALALCGSDRLPVAILGDGDMLMGATALWTAAHYHIPLLVIVANNRTYLNDEAHQERVATVRGRPVENRWVGQRIDDPAPDFANLASSLGLQGLGPVTTARQLDAALRTAIAAVATGAAVVVDVRVAAHPYPGGPVIARTDDHSGRGR